MSQSTNPKTQKEVRKQEEEKKKEVLKEKIKAFDLGAMKEKKLEDKVRENEGILQTERFKAVDMLGQISSSLSSTKTHVIYSDVGYENSENATLDRIKSWIAQNKIYALNLMAVDCDVDCQKIPGMYRGNGQQIAKQAYFFPFVPIAFVTKNKGSFTPPRVNIAKSGKKYSSALQLITILLEGRSPWTTQKYANVQALSGQMLGNPVKMSTIEAIVKSQTIPVTNTGQLVFREATITNLQAASVNPLDYILQMQAEKTSKNQGRDWLETKMEYKQLKFNAHVLIETKPQVVNELLAKTSAVKPEVKTIKRE